MTNARLNPKARALLTSATYCAQVSHDGEVKPEHLLYVLIKDAEQSAGESTIVDQLLTRHGITLEKLEETDFWRERNARRTHGRATRPPRFEQMRECDTLAPVYKYARRNLEVTHKDPRQALRPVDLLIGIVMLPCSGVSRFFKELGVDYVKLRTDMIHLREERALAA